MVLIFLLEGSIIICWTPAYVTKTGEINVIEIEGLLFPDFGKCACSMENWFFPSSDVTRALKNGAL